MDQTHRRKPGDRVAVMMRGRIQKRTAPTGEVVAHGHDWQLEGMPTAFRYRCGRNVVDISVQELREAFDRAMVTTFDHDYGMPLQRTVATRPDGTVISVAEDGSLFYGNDRFTVHLHVWDEEAGMAGPVRLSVHDHHRSPDVAWRLLQRIKTELVGTDRWAAEWYPPEDRLVDESNERHLFVMPAETAPPEWMAYHQDRSVIDTDAASAVGAIQTPLPSWYPEAAQ